MHRANGLLQQDGNLAVIELSLAKCTLVIEEPTLLAISGAPTQVTLNAQQEDRRALELSRGDELAVEIPPVGARVYIAAKDGFLGPRIFGSVSGHSLKPGDSLKCGDTPLQEKSDVPPQLKLPVHTLNVIPGPQAASLDWQMFLNAEFKVSHSSNRAGVRLEGDLQPHDLELTSEPACIGAIQLDRTGAPIIVGPDGPTIGGYPKIAAVCESNLDFVGQLRPGQSLRFIESESN